MLTTIRSSIIACPVVWHEVGEEWWAFGMVVTNIMFCTTSANIQIKFSSVVLLLSQVPRRAFLLSFLREIGGKVNVECWNGYIRDSSERIFKDRVYKGRHMVRCFKLMTIAVKRAKNS